MKRLWKNYSLGIVLASLFLAAWIAQALTGWQEFKSEQHALGQPADIFTADGYIWNFARTTFENWQSEFLQLLAFVVLTTYLIYKNSHESRDGQDEMRAELNRMERRINELQKGPARSKAS